MAPCPNLYLTDLASVLSLRTPQATTFVPTLLHYASFYGALAGPYTGIECNGTHPKSIPTIMRSGSSVPEESVAFDLFWPKARP